MKDCKGRAFKMQNMQENDKPEGCMNTVVNIGLIQVKIQRGMMTNKEKNILGEHLR